MITGAPVPALGNAGGAQLHEAEGYVGSHEHMAVAAGANFGIHEGRQVCVVLGGVAGGHEEGCRSK